MATLLQIQYMCVGQLNYETATFFILLYTIQICVEQGKRGFQDNKVEKTMKNVVSNGVASLNVNENDSDNDKILPGIYPKI